jgi:hypothetical protein
MQLVSPGCGTSRDRILAELQISYQLAVKGQFLQGGTCVSPLKGAHTGAPLHFTFLFERNSVSAPCRAGCPSLPLFGAPLDGFSFPPAPPEGTRGSGRSPADQKKFKQYHHHAENPLFFLVAGLIKLSSLGGPVFFVQDRIGGRKRKIKVIIFRTMAPGAEQSLTAVERFHEASGPVFKIKNDPRITFLGRSLRKTSIDELPRLFNVLKGDMSLVGPRLLPVRCAGRWACAAKAAGHGARPGILFRFLG